MLQILLQVFFLFTKVKSEYKLPSEVGAMKINTKMKMTVLVVIFLEFIIAT